MENHRAQTLLYAAAAAVIAAVGFAFVVRPGDSARWTYTVAAFGVAFFGLSAVPRIREHDAYNALGAAFATAVCSVTYLESEVLFVGLLVILSAVGTVVELYNWRAKTEYLRL